MAGRSLFALLDDISTLLDDVATMTKLATQKTAGVLSDDLALNAEQVSGVRASRELPVVWSVAKGSALNKLILIPGALLIQQFVPWLITALLIIGGAYLCYEGVEKLLHTFIHRRQRHQPEEAKKHVETVSAMSAEDIVKMEKDKIKGAIRTDFILSAEIIVIALNVVKEYPLLTQVSTLIAVAALITVGVYGLVAGIVKLDDAGFWLVKRHPQKKSFLNKLGLLLINAAPYLMKFLSVVGTIAMFLVGGGLIEHNIHALHQVELSMEHWMTQVPAGGELLVAVTPSLFSLVVGFIIGAITLLFIKGVQGVLEEIKSPNKSY
ncbi:MAG: DUF808 domain-containing protein [Saezia sp.]